MKSRIVWMLFFACFFAGLSRGDDVSSFRTQQRAWEDLSHVTRGDLAFFFDRVTFQDGQWVFKLSPNVSGMLWRIRNDHSDVTGACESGQVLTCAGASSLEIKRKDLDLVLQPRGLTGYQVYLRFFSASNSSQATEEREAIMVAHEGAFRLMYAED